MTNTVISSWNGITNIGSEAILKVTIENLAKNLDKSQLMVLSWSPEKTNKIYGVRSISHFNLLKQILLDYRSKNYILGGGDLINDFGKGLSFWLGKSALARFLSCNLNIFSVGVRQIKSSQGKFIAKKILNKAETISVRDRESLKYLRDLKIEGAQLTADPAFLLKKGNEQKISKILKKYEINQDKEILGITVRHWVRIRKKYSPVIFYNPKKLLKELAEACDYFSSKGIQIVFLPTQVSPYADDRKVGEALNKMTKNKIKVVRELYSPEVTRGLIGNFDSYLSMRLHGIIFSCLEKVPCIGINYNFAPRIKHIMKELNLGGYILSLEDIESKNIIKKVRLSLKSKKEIKKELKRSNKELKNRAEKGFSILKNGLR